MSYTFKTLGEVAHVLDDRRGSFPGSMRPLRKGPYLLYQGSSTVPFDDFTFDGSAVLLGTAGNVVGTNRCFNVALVEGKFAVGDAYHVVACDDPADTEYLAWVLSRTPIHGYAEMTGESIRLSDQALRNIHIPWPEAGVRRAFVRFMKDSEERTARCKRESRTGFEQACADYAAAATKTMWLGDACEVVPGRFLAAEARSSEGRLPIVCAQGVIGYTDELGVEEPCMVIVQAGVRLQGYRMFDGAYPLQDAAALIVQPNVPMTLEELVLAMGALGARPYANMVDGKPDTLKAKLEDLPNLRVAVYEGEDSAAVAAAAQEAIARADALEQESKDAERGMGVMAHDLIACEPDVPERLAAWVEEGVDEVAARVVPAPEDGAQDAPEDAASACFAALGEALAQVAGAVEKSKTPLFDAAWEVMPLLFLRSVPDGAVWRRVVEAAAPLAQADAELLRIAEEAPALAALGGLTSKSSSLPEDVRLAAMRALDALPDPKACGLGQGDLVRWLASESATESVKRRNSFVEQRLDAPCPPTVSSLFGEVVAAFKPDAATVLDPCAKDGAALAACARHMPDATFHAQTERFTDALAATMAAYCEGWGFAEGAPQVGVMLTDDRFGTDRFDVVVSMLPSNPGMWFNKKLDDDDPRWLQFGFPPRSRANFAWLMQSYYHRAEGGYVVLLISDALLHESRGSESVTRATLIESGCVRAVVTLPGGIYDDDRAPSCIVVLGDRREGEEHAEAETLFVNALELGTPRVATAWPTHRSFPAAEAERAAAVVREWVQAGTIEPQPGYARSVPKSEVAALGDLTPWSFV